MCCLMSGSIRSWNSILLRPVLRHFFPATILSDSLACWLYCFFSRHYGSIPLHCFPYGASFPQYWACSSICISDLEKRARLWGFSWIPSVVLHAVWSLNGRTLPVRPIKNCSSSFRLWKQGASLASLIPHICSICFPTMAVKVRLQLDKLCSHFSKK